MGKGVLFVCYGNACRSIMAEAIARHHFSGYINIASAGIAALGRVPETTLEVLKEIDISCEELYSKNIHEIDISCFDIIVNLTDMPIYRLIPDEFQGKIIDIYVRDPYGGNQGLFRQTRDVIEQLVLRKVPTWLE